MTENVYIACLDWNFVWTKSDVEEVRQMWKMGIPLDYIAENFDRDKDETAMLLMDLIRKRKIRPRKGGWLGKSFEQG
jgi:hypothetical protein